MSEEEEQQPRRNHVLVFDYGALYHEKLTHLVGDVEVFRGGILPQHRLSFAGTSRMFQGSSVATVTPNKEYDVLGIIYKLNLRQVELLDLFFECSLGLSIRRKAVVRDGKKKEHDVHMYVVATPNASRDKDGRVQPSPAYADHHKTLVIEAFWLYWDFSIEEDTHTVTVAVTTKAIDWSTKN